MKLKIFLLNSLLGITLLAGAQPYASLANTPENQSSDFAPFAIDPDDYKDVPGFVNPNDYIGKTCFDFMGSVNFTSEYRFKTEETVGNTDRLHGFTIPLAGDLDGDGYPEIVSIAQSGTNDLNGSFTGIRIYNGQNGALIGTSRFVRADGSNITSSFTHSGVHTSPSLMSLVDSDRDGIVELIISFPNGGGDSDFRSKLVSYKLVPTKDGNGITTSYSLVYNWMSAEKYNSDLGNSYEKPLPTIVDLDGDGIPEVVVYNKIYNAVTGALLLTLEPGTGTSSSTRSKAHIGYDENAYDYDDYIGFNYVYDMNLDGVYDIVAGGKVYKITKEGSAFNYQKIEIVNIPDGRTGVADIDGDGLPDVVVLTRTGVSQTSKIQVIVWNPGFHKVENGNIITDSPAGNPRLMAQRAFSMTRDGGSGSNSYVYIGDIDGREQTITIDGVQKICRLPEIAFMARRYGYSQDDKLEIHPNVSGYPVGSGANQGGIPTKDSEATTTSDHWGDLIGITWDATPGLSTDQRLKLSFVLEHNDTSNNTGFTMFDFDNDGMQEICYRDEQTLRIIKASRPYIAMSNDINDGTNSVLFKSVAKSYTGFEYPIIVDVDNDASAEMAVLANKDTHRETRGYVYVVGNGSGDKFAPALSVWNQFMYDPFKINEDLTTPLGPAPNRLTMKFSLSKIIRDGDMEITKVIEDYNPYNGTLTQMSRFQLSEIEWNGQTYENAFEPIVFLTHAYFVEPSTTNPAKNPAIIKEGSQAYITAWVGNEAAAQTDVSQNTPIAVYKNEISETTLHKMITLSQAGLGAAVKAGEEKQVKIPIDDEYGYYILRLGDNSFSVTSPYPFSGSWSWGTNDLDVQDVPNRKGTAARAYRDCNWDDQLIRVSKFVVTDDAYTLQEYKKIGTPILNNDILPDDFVGGFDGSNPQIVITEQPKSGILTASGEINNITSTNTINVSYQHTGDVELTDGIDMFEYQISYYDGASSTTKTVKAKAYFYILQNKEGGYTTCVGDDLTISLKTLPTGTTFKWYEADGITELPNNPQSSITVTNVTSTLKYMVDPQIPSSHTEYGNINFPKGELTIHVIASTSAALKWTGTINQLWYNPFNWSDIDGNPVEYTPAGCVDVTIPMVTTNYPQLLSAAKCGKLTLLDRAMIDNIHKLTYEDVSIEMKIKDAEQNRWLMLSAPLRSVYSGDYKVRDGQGNQIERASYISLYNSQNPDNTHAPENSVLTRPFGKIEQSLGLGTGFMLYVDKLFAVNPVFKFPSTLDKYLYSPSSAVGAISRDYDSELLSRVDGGGNNVSGRFIFEGASNYNATDGSFTITLNDEKYHLVVNPFPTYLNLNEFLTENTILEPQYKIWTGKSDDTFMEMVNGADKAPRWEISSTATMVSVDISTGAPAVYIAPYQAFFVKKKTAGAGSSVISFKPETMTEAKAGDYTL